MPRYIDADKLKTRNGGEQMSDLISRQAAIDEANAWLLDCFKVQKQDRSCGLIRRLEDLPSVDVVHAHWDEKEDCSVVTDIPWSMCSACGEYSLKLPYCAFCGAKMDEEVVE